jgi:hypothetical protein
MSSTQELQSTRLPLLAIGEWLMALPAILFIAVSALRDAQPSQYEPAHTSLIVFEWFAHLPGSVLAVLLIGLPTLVVMIGCVSIFRTWRGDAELRQDSLVAFAILRRRMAPFLLAAATLVAGGIATLVVAHLITD